MRRIVLLAGLILVSGCSKEKATPVHPKFKSGDIVAHILDGRKGIVIRAFDGYSDSDPPVTPFYEVCMVRHKSGIEVNTATGGVFDGSGGTAYSSNQPYVDVYLKEFEIVPYPTGEEAK